MPIDLPLREALTERINQLLGPPNSETGEMRRWIRGPFELGMTLTEAPSLWLETCWHWDNVQLFGIGIEFYSMGQPRHRDLYAGFAHLPTKPLYHITPRPEQLEAVMAYLGDCLQRASKE